MSLETLLVTLLNYYTISSQPLQPPYIRITIGMYNNRQQVLKFTPPSWSQYMVHTYGNISKKKKTICYFSQNHLLFMLL